MQAQRKILLLVATLVGIVLLGWLALELGAGASDGGGRKGRTAGAAAATGAGGALAGAGERPVPARRAAAELEAVAVSQGVPAGSLLTGRVVDIDGRSISGARVLVAHVQEWANASLFVEVDPDNERYRRVELTTDADGRFHGRRLRAGLSRVAVQADGYAARDLGREVLPAGGVLDLGQITLDGGAVLEGRVVDVDGLGVAGARLAREEKAEGANWGGGGFVPVAVTGGDGTFRTPTLALGSWELRVESEGHPTAWFEGSVDAAGVAGGHVFRLPRAWSIAGRLELPGVSDLAGYSVRAKYVGERDALPEHRADALRRTAECTRDGSFTITGLLAADATTRYSLQGRRPGRFARQVGDQVEATVGSQNVLLLAEPPAGMTFELRDASDGTPIEDPEAWLVIRGGNTIDLVTRESFVRTGPGRYRVEDIVRPSAAGSFALRVRKEGFRTATRFDLNLTAGVVRDLGALELEPAPTLVVEVVDAASGEPLEGAEVVRDVPWKRVSADGGSTVVHSDRSSVRKTTDASGTVRLPLGVDDPNQVAAFHPDHAPVVAAPVLAASNPGSLRLALTRGASLRVRVADSLGRAVAGESVGCRLNDLTEVMRAFNPASRKTNHSAVTDRAGEVLFEYLAPGSVDVYRLGGSEEEIQSLVMEDGGAYELTFVAPVRTELEVLVRASGVPLAGAYVGLWVGDEDDADDVVRPLWQSWEASWGTTGSDGRVRLEGVVLGDYELFVSHGTRDLGSTQALQVALDPALVVIDLSASGVDGKVSTPGGAPAEDCPVYVLAQRDLVEGLFERLFTSVDDSRFPANTVGAGQTRSDADGRFRFRGLPEGVPLVLVAIAPDTLPGVSAPFRLEADEILSLPVLSVRPAGSLRLRIESEKGSAVTFKAQLEPLSEDVSTSALRSTTFRSSGLATVRHLAPGEWRVRLVRRHGSSAPFDERVVRVRAGEQTELELRPPR